MSESKLPYSDNIAVSRTKWGTYFVSIWVTETVAVLTRYGVPGRIDTYSFSWIPRVDGRGDRVSLFTDTGVSVAQAAKLVKRDLNRPQVKALLKAARKTLGEYNYRYVAALLNALR